MVLQNHTQSKTEESRKNKISSAQIIALGFASLILLGTLLLMLPISSQSREWTSFGDALFTSTSCCCVTGLVVHDTATYWSVFGKVVIITLIQIGGMGVVTFALLVAMAGGRRIGLRQRTLLQNSVSAPTVGGIVKHTRFIVKGTALFEGIGAVIIYPSMAREFGYLKAIPYSIFHSISAFCNAGFDLMGTEGAKYQSLTRFPTDPLMNMGIMFLIIVGGLGFFTWSDIKNHKGQFKRYSLQSKLSIVMAAILCIVPAVIFFFAEFNHNSIGERIWLSLFQSVTTRTAGFNTIDFGKMSQSGIMLMILLMLTGASPGSTGGGMKTTTIAVLFATATSVFVRRNAPHFLGRRVGYDTIKRAVSILTMYITLFFMGGMIIFRVEQPYIEGLSLLDCLFESASAVATVGLTMGITPSLHALSKIILIALMYFGRVGGLTLIFAAVSNTKTAVSQYPKEDLTIG